jgi:hypothetical protein
MTGRGWAAVQVRSQSRRMLGLRAEWGKGSLRVRWEGLGFTPQAQAQARPSRFKTMLSSLSGAKRGGGRRPRTPPPPPEQEPETESLVVPAIRLLGVERQRAGKRGISRKAHVPPPVVVVTWMGDEGPRIMTIAMATPEQATALVTALQSVQQEAERGEAPCMELRHCPYGSTNVGWQGSRTRPTRARSTGGTSCSRP